jgi:hypothetical protein
MSFPLLSRGVRPIETRRHHSGATFSTCDISINKFVRARGEPFSEDLRAAHQASLKYLSGEARERTIYLNRCGSAADDF